MQYRRFSGITSFVLVYMLLAFVWWSVLLFHKNKDAFLAKKELLELGMKLEGIIQNEEQLFQTERYQTLKKDYQKQENMILGEGVAFSLSILIGMFIVYRSYRKELKVSQQQRNFLLSITHELKSPIASVRLSLETIAKQYLKLSPDQIKRLSTNGIKDADRLNKLVGNLLLSARLENTYQFHIEEIDVTALVEQTYQYFSDPYSELSIRLSIEKDIPLINGDKEALTSMLMNLIENAIKYSSATAEVELVLKKKAGSFIEIVVKDQGIGVPKKEKGQIFTKFYRVGNENTRTTKGTGLGLYIVHEIIKGHGGQISVTNNQPRGSIFSVILPCITINQLKK